MLKCRYDIAGLLCSVLSVGYPTYRTQPAMSFQSFLRTSKSNPRSPFSIFQLTIFSRNTHACRNWIHSHLSACHYIGFMAKANWIRTFDNKLFQRCLRISSHGSFLLRWLQQASQSVHVVRQVVKPDFHRCPGKADGTQEQVVGHHRLNTVYIFHSASRFTAGIIALSVRAC